MMNIVKKILLFTIIVIYVIYIFTNRSIINVNIINTLYMYINNIFTSLFPFIFTSNMLIYLNFPFYLNKIFKLSICDYIFIMSLISGCPSNAIMIKNLVKDKSNIPLLLSYTLFNNPIFLYNLLINIFNKSISIKIILINYFVNFILYLILRKKEAFNINIYNISFSEALINSIKNTIDTLLFILGIIVFFNIINFDNIIIKGIIEITNGLYHLNNLNTSILIKEIIAMSFVSFSGLSIQIQIKSIINDTSIKYYNYYYYRLIHLLLSIILILLMKL